MQPQQRRKLTKSERRAQQKLKKKIEQKIRLGTTAKIRDPSSGKYYIIDGGREKHAREMQAALRSRLKWGTRIVPIQLILWWIWRLMVSTNNTLPRQFRVLSVLLSIPLLFLCRILLGFLVPRTREREGGGTFYAAIIFMVVTMELTRLTLWISGVAIDGIEHGDEEFFKRGFLYAFTAFTVSLIPFVIGGLLCGGLITVALTNLSPYQWYDYTMKADIVWTASMALWTAFSSVRSYAS